jgi:quinol monooxygenase YgiN
LFALFVRFDLKPSGAAGFDDLVSELVPLVRLHEPGTLAYVCAKDHADPEGGRLFFEVYRDREAFDEHERQEHVKRFLAARREYTVGLRVEFAEPFAAKGLDGP